VLSSGVVPRVLVFSTNDERIAALVKTILLIDDDEICRAPAAELLRRNHWRVFEAEDGESGLQLAVQHRPDIILCDLLMPRINGYQVCRAVREHIELRHTKIIVVTGRDYAADRKSAEEAGADAYLVKPIEFSKLKEAMDRVLPAMSDGQQPSEPAPARSAPDSVTMLKFWGVRGSIPAPGRGSVFFGGNTSCVELRTDGEHIICDAGSGIRPLGLALDAEAGLRPIHLTLLVTHSHWDHIQGFPFFVPAYQPRNKLRILGYEGASDCLRDTLAGQMESPYFPVALNEMPGNIEIQELKEMSFHVGSIHIEACFTNHPGICVGYKFHTSGGVIVYMPDNETQSCDDGGSGTFVPSTIDSNIAEFIHEADLLILDAQYTREEYQKHIGWGHGCVDEVVTLAVAAKVKRLYLFHHDPAHDDRFISGMLMHARELAQAAGSEIRIEAAREGEQVTLSARVAVRA
jgi:phosphoribosyl 1,2-cyclic phosphodiesterase/CheY-like chemotaxis protein